MDFFSQSNSGNSIIDLIPQENDQVSILEERNRDYDYYDDSQLIKEIILNSNLYHRNVNKIVDFGINKTNNGPFEFGIQFKAKYFINIIREYYLKLNCERINFIVSDRLIYIYGHFDCTLKIITIFNTRFISPDKVKILEGHGKEFRANFDVVKLLKNLELHNFTNKEFLKLYFKFNKNSKKTKNENKSFTVNNPFLEFQADIFKFEKDFNFEDEAIPGFIIIEADRDFKVNIESNYAPLELCAPPQIPDSIFTNYIFSINIDNLSYCAQRMNLQSPIEIYCNKYICNLISNFNSENFITYNNTEGVDFKNENAFNYFKLFDPMVENGTLYKKMIQFSLSKPEFDALKIINKKTSVIFFYADKNEKYYFSKETDQEGNIASSIILKSSERKPKIRDIEDCCLYIDHWEEWLNYLSNILSRDCINDLKKLRENKGIKNMVSNNKKNKRKIEKNEEDNKNGNNDNNRKNLNRSKNVRINDESELPGVFIYSNDKKGTLSKIKINENSNQTNIYDLGRGKNNNEKLEDNNKENENKDIVNPFI